jgi:hypothetical protein
LCLFLCSPSVVCSLLVILSFLNLRRR